MSDKDCQEYELVSVCPSDDGGWNMELEPGLHFYCPKDSPVVPEPGMKAVLYGKGFGYSVRGLDLNGRRVFYRTESEDQEYREAELYGDSAAEWLHRWDSGRSVWSVEMGGIGPGYEQCIQIIAAELLRYLLRKRPDHESWSNSEEAWKAASDAMDSSAEAKAVMDRFGPSGAQWGAARSLACALYVHGPKGLFGRNATKPVPDERRIQVSRDFPS